MNFLYITLTLLNLILNTKKMFKANLYLVRHAETEANKANILQGHSDYPLTEEGVNQALEAGNTLKDIEWSRIFSSDLPRAARSCELILSQSNTVKDHTDFSKIHYLRELSFGAREGLDKDLPLEEAIATKAKLLNIPVDEVVHKVETPEEILERQKQLFAHIYEDCSDLHDKQDIPNILCVSHGAFIKRILINFGKAIKVTKLSNCSINILKISYLSKDNFTCEYLEE